MATNRSRRSRRDYEGRDESTRGTYGGHYGVEEESNGGSRYRDERDEPRSRKATVRQVGRKVGKTVSSMDLDKALVLLHTALALAIVIKQTRPRGRERRAEPFRSAMSVLNYYLNEGRELSEMQRATLEDIKEELRMLYNREDDDMMSPSTG